MDTDINLRRWLDTSLPGLVDELEKSINSGYHIEGGDTLSISGRDEIYKILDTILGVLFPGRYSPHKPLQKELHYFIHDSLRHIGAKLHRHLDEIFTYYCRDRKENCDCRQRVDSIIRILLTSLPKIRRDLIEDIHSAYDGDPAANNFDEIVLSYPFIEAIATHRVSHLLYKEGVPIIPRIMSERAHSRTGIDIHPGASIAPGFFIDHGTGVVIGETVTIGRNVKVYQGVTLGAISPFDKEGTPRRGQKRHPDIEDDVIIYANATILGGKTVIGKGAVIGGNTWITESVPPGAVVYSNC
ncbi:MAG: serine acetyltransferase [Spirochaetales bacterium]|nr:serine acetyltransferase [Spirochaetales bacterium]